MHSKRHDFREYSETRNDKALSSQTDKQAECAALVGERRTEGQQNRTALVIDWLMNKAFHRNDQWVIADQDSFTQDVRLRRPRRPSWARRVTANTMFNDLRVAVAKVTSKKLQPGVSPVTSDESDRAKARGLEGLLRYFVASEECERKKVLLATELCETGLGWLRIGWDPNRGDFLEPPQDVDELDVKVDKFQREGAIDIRVRSPLNVLTDPGPTRHDDCRWMIDTHVLHVDEIFELYGVHVPSDRGMTTHHVLDEQTDIAPEHHDAPNMALVTEYWQKPDKNYPTGVYCVEAGGLCLYMEEGMEEFPFVKYEFFPDPDSQYPITPVSHARELQRELNINLSMMVQGRDLSIYGKWVNPMGNGVTNITRAPGEIIDFDPHVGPPQYVRIDPYSPQISELTMILADLKQKTVGIDDATLGKSSSSQSGRSIAFQAEEDLAKLGPTMACWKASWRKAFLLMAKTWKKYARGPIRYEVLGSNAKADIAELDRSDIEFHDIEVSLHEALPENKQARRELVVMLMQSGVIDQNEARRMLEFGDVEDAFGSQNTDRQRARHENDLLLHQDVGVEMHENHVVHMEVLLQYMKNDVWYSLDDQSKQRYRNHLHAHMAMMQGANAGSGGPPPAGGPQQGAAPPSAEMEPDAPTSAASEELQPQEEEAVDVIRGQV